MNARETRLISWKIHFEKSLIKAEGSLGWLELIHDDSQSYQFERLRTFSSQTHALGEV